jgi:hypothetical protein
MKTYGALLAGIAFVGCSFAVHAAENKYFSQQGVWATNMTATKVPPGGFNLTKDLMVVTKDDGKILEFTYFVQSKEGVKKVADYSGDFEGKEHPFRGSMLKHMRLPDGRTKDVLTTPKGVMAEEIITMSKDGKQLVFDGKMTQPDGKTYTYLYIYDRVNW